MVVAEGGELSLYWHGVIGNLEEREGGVARKSSSSAKIISSFARRTRVESVDRSGS